jgi:MFS family permease
MAFQFQSVGAVSPLIAETYGVSLADMGWLIGLYLAPGIVVAIPGGAIAARFGDKRIVMLSMVLMLIGVIMIALAPTWGWLMAGRVIGGVGGVIINVIMTKMLVDWFAGREISTAMGVFINSWPVGIALALLVLPSLATTGGLTGVWAFVMGIIGFALGAFALLYKTPPTTSQPAAVMGGAGFPIVTLTLASTIWALYNVGLAMVFAFGPSVLSERGWSLTAASSTTSIFVIATAIALPLGGIIADRTGRRDTVILISLIGYSALIPLVLFSPAWGITIALSVAGFFFGLGAGPIMTLPAVILRPDSRALGMGVFFSIYYALMMAGPAIAGALADRTGGAGVTFLFGSALLIACIPALGIFRLMTRIKGATISP